MGGRWLPCRGQEAPQRALRSVYNWESLGQVVRRASAERARAGAPGAERRLLMSHAVQDVVDAELVGLIGLVNWPEPGCGELPEVRHVGVVVHQGHHRLLRVVVLIDPEEPGTAA